MNYSNMPELFRLFGIKLFFFSREHLPIHIQNTDRHAKYETDPMVKLVESKNMKAKDLRLAESIIEENKDLIKKRWEEYHGTD